MKTKSPDKYGFRSSSSRISAMSVPYRIGVLHKKKFLTKRISRPIVREQVDGTSFQKDPSMSVNMVMWL